MTACIIPTQLAVRQAGSSTAVTARASAGAALLAPVLAPAENLLPVRIGVCAQEDNDDEED